MQKKFFNAIKNLRFWGGGGGRGEKDVRTIINLSCLNYLLNTKLPFGMQGLSWPGGSGMDIAPHRRCFRPVSIGR
jgi:hypothetical protein